jgi:regulator of protease activity HflC (stomatin/prohibitin superfamily)
MGDADIQIQGILLLAIAAFVLFVWITRCLVRVPQGTALLVESFGKYKRTLGPGLNFVFWPVQKPKRDIRNLYTYSQRRQTRGAARKTNAQGDMQPDPAPVVELHHNGHISLAEHMMDPPDIWAIASDNTRLMPDVLVFFAIVDAAEAVYGVENLGESMNLLIQSTLRQEIASRNSDSVLQSRTDIGAALTEALEGATSSWGVKILRVEIQEILFAEEIQEALTIARRAELEGRARKVQAERESEAMIIEAEARKRADILAAEAHKAGVLIRAEAERDQQVLTAEGQKQAQILLAQGRMEGELMRARGLEAVGKVYASCGDGLLTEDALRAQVDIAKGLGANGATVVVPESIAGLTGALTALTRAWKSSTN